MRILLIHNKYKQSGGEDSVFLAESSLLVRHGHEVNHMIYDNSVINTFFDKCLSGILTIYNPSSAKALKIIIKEFNPDVIHIHNFLPIISPSVLFVAKRYQIPVVLTLHNYRLICPSATLYYNGKIYEKSIHSLLPMDAIWKGVYRNSRIQTAVVALMTAVHNVLGTWKNKVDCYIALTQFAKDKFENSSLSIPSGKMFVKANFVADPGMEGVEREDFFLFLGRLTEEKGITTLLRAARLLSFKITFIGDGPLRKMVEDAVQQNSNICFLGFQPKSVVMGYLKKTKALLFPSIWYEGFPLTILEAFSTGTPVITSHLGSMVEIVQHGVNGLHFEPGNERDLIAKIIEIDRNKSLAKRLSYHARLSYLQHYTPERNYDQLLGVYNAVLQQRNEINRLKQLPMAQLVDL